MPIPTRIAVWIILEIIEDVALYYLFHHVAPRAIAAGRGPDFIAAVCAFGGLVGGLVAVLGWWTRRWRQAHIPAVAATSRALLWGCCYLVTVTIVFADPTYGMLVFALLSAVAGPIAWGELRRVWQREVVRRRARLAATNSTGGLSRSTRAGTVGGMGELDPHRRDGAHHGNPNPQGTQRHQDPRRARRRAHHAPGAPGEVDR